MAAFCLETALISRRSLLGAAALLGPLLRTGSATQCDPILSAICLAQTADALHRAAWLDLYAHLPGFASRPADRERLAVLREDRRAARLTLHRLTPSSAAGARALVAYYASRATACDDAGVAKAARRRLRKVFARPSAHRPDFPLPAPLAVTESAVMPLPLPG